MGCGKVSQIQTLTPEQTAEIAMVDLAHMLLVETSEPVQFQELMNRIGTIKNLSQEEVEQMMVQIYTEINLDGRFMNVGNSAWGLKKWYPVEQFDDVSQPAPKGKRKAIIDDDLDEFDLDDDFVDDFEEEVFEEEEVEEAVDFEEEEEEELVDEDFVEEDEVELDFEAEEESLEELAEEEDVEDEEM